MEGWIHLHREWLDHWLYNENRPHTRREAWEDMLLLVNHTDKEVSIGNEIYVCKRGQSVRSLESWGKHFNWNKSKVKRYFDLLAKCNMIITENLNKTTRVTICDYDVYMGSRNGDETETKRKRNVPKTSTRVNNNEKNKKNSKNEIKPDTEILTENLKENGDIYIPKT